jgi:hypothetical protein
MRYNFDIATQHKALVIANIVEPQWSAANRSPFAVYLSAFIRVKPEVTNALSIT